MWNVIRNFSVFLIPDEKEKDEESKENKKEEIKENGETDEKKEGDEEKMDTENSEGKSEKDSEKKEDGEKDEKEENKTADKKSEDGDAEKGEDDSKKPKDDFDEKQRHQLKHRELFLSRQVQTLHSCHTRALPFPPIAVPHCSSATSGPSLRDDIEISAPTTLLHACVLA